MAPGRGSWADRAGSLGAVRGAAGAGFAGLPGAGARRAGGGDWGGGGAAGASVLPLAATGGKVKWCEPWAQLLRPLPAPTCCLSRCRVFAQVSGIQGLGCAEHKIG